MPQKTVYVELIAETKKLNAGMKKADKRVSKLTGAFKKLGGTIIAAFGARAVFRGFTQTIKSLDDLIKTAKGVGFTAKQYERLTFALSEVGVGAESARIALGDFQKRLARPSFQKFFREAGFKPEELLKMPAEDQLMTVLERLADLRNDPRLASVAGLIFEEQSGKDIRKVLLQWDRFLQARKDYERIVKRGLSKEDADNIEEVGKQARLLGLRWTVLKRNIVLDVVPDILDGLEKLEKADAFKNITESVMGLANALREISKDVRFFASLLDGLDASIPDWMKSLFRISGVGALVEISKAPFTELREARLGANPPSLLEAARAGSPAPSQVSNIYEIKVDATGDSVISRKNAQRVGDAVSREVAQ